jgi:cellobiose phosphorylase
MYRLITESLLGLKLDIDRLHFSPCLPAEWKSFRISYRYRETSYHITLLNSNGLWQGPPSVTLDGVQQPGSFLLLQGDRREHKVEVRFL